jgi:hypothetical protein
MQLILEIEAFKQNRPLLMLSKAVVVYSSDTGPVLWSAISTKQKELAPVAWGYLRILHYSAAFPLDSKGRMSTSSPAAIKRAPLV